MMDLFLVLIFLTVATALEDCQTPTNQPGKCVLINHCPHLFSSILQNQTANSKNLIRQSHCGFESKLFPKVCCPEEAIKLFDENGAISQNQYSTKCGLHTPESPSDPWLALLEYENDEGERSFLCGGVLINKRYVLTAAHCVKGRRIPPNFKLSKVHLGAYNTDMPLVIHADGSTAHEDYDPDDSNQYNDIGLVRLKNKVNFKQEFMRPICVPMKEKNYLGKKLQVTGYQKLESTLKKRDGIAAVWNNSDCHLTYNLMEVRLRDSQICAGGKMLSHRHSQRTDFGGVLMHVAKDNTYSAVGILSLQPSCCDKDNYPKVYTKVASYMDWIISNLKP